MVKILLNAFFICFLIHSPLFSQIELLKDINPGSASGAVDGQATFGYFKSINGKIYFRGINTSTGGEIWSSDGTGAGTKILNDINIGVGYGGDVPVFTINNKLIYKATTTTYKSEPWICDLDGGNASLLKDIATATSGEFTSGILGNFTGIAFQNMVFFAANNGINGKELWVTNGTPAGTMLLKDILPGDKYSDSNPGNFTILGNELFFLAANSIWKSDGTTLGTVQVLPTGVTCSTDMIAFNGDLYFGGSDAGSGHELWKTNGTVGSAVLVKDINTGSPSSYVSNITEGEDIIFFTAQNSTIGNELYKSDGTEAGTSLVKDINTGTGHMIPSFTELHRFHMDGILYFAANNGIKGAELWRSNGTSSGTFMIKDINSSSPSSFPSHIKGNNDLIFFQANDGSHGKELWKSDGTEAGTVLMQDINTGSASANPFNLTFVENRLYFTATTAEEGTEVFYVDNPCFSYLTAENISYFEGRGIGCDSAALVEFSFTSNYPYDTWSLAQADILLLGYDGNWSAPKGQNITVSIPAPKSPEFPWTFYAYPDDNVSCTGLDVVFPVPTNGCDDEVAFNYKKNPTGPNSNDGILSFKLTTSACAAVSGWSVVVTNIETGLEYGAAAEAVGDSLFVDELPIGSYTIGFTNYICPFKVVENLLIFLDQANDDCDKAKNLTPTPGVFGNPGEQAITGTSNSGVASSCYNTTGAPDQNDLWYTMDFDNANSGNVSLAVTPEVGGFDPAITVYKGNSCGALTEIPGGCVNNFQGYQSESFNFDPSEHLTGELEVRENVRFYIKITDINGTGGNFNFQLQGIPLPVTLISFEAVAANTGGVLMSWKVSDEVNIKNYWVERSADGKSWKTIGVVAAGNTSGYSFIDKNPIQGINYYRLNIHENDGKTSLSGTRSVSIGDLISLKVYPNPANDIIKIAGNNEVSVVLEIFNLDGVLFRSEIISGIKLASQGIDISDLISGVFIARVKGQNTTQTARFIKN